MLDKYNVVKTTVTIAGQQRAFVELDLVQAFNAHHEFRIVINYEAFGQQWMSEPRDIIALVGEEVVISMVHTLSGTRNSFFGLVTNAVISGKNGRKNNVVVIGKGQTIRLDGKKAMNSFMNKSLSSIVAEAIENLGSNAEIRIKPTYQDKIDYICQYNETDFEFLNRLSYIYGEWFWDTGREIRFGKGTLSDETPLRLIYDVNMITFELSVNLIPARFNRYGYLVHLDNEVEAFAPKDVPNVQGYQYVVLKKSDAVYSAEGDLPVDAPIVSKQNLNSMVELERSRAAAEMLTISGTSRTCLIQLGKNVHILMPSSVRFPTVDVFMVTYVKHHVDEIGRYRNSFRGIVSNMSAVPMEPVEPPRTGPQQATVLSNADPENKGRVQVQFQWQKGLRKSTNWIRVQTPDAGSSGKVKSNRGFVCIPEEGDTVMVGFDYGDPNRPYVMGSLFSEVTGAGGGQGNKGKSIVSRSGNALKLDDESGSVSMNDQSGNRMDFDGSDTITIKAKDHIIITNGKCKIEMQGEKIILSAPEEISFDSKNIGVLASDLLDMKGKEGSTKIINIAAEDKLAVDVKSEIHITSKDKLEISSTNEMTVGTSKLSITGKDTVAIDSQEVNINS